MSWAAFAQAAQSAQEAHGAGWLDHPLLTNPLVVGVALATPGAVVWAGRKLGQLLGELRGMRHELGTITPHFRRPAPGEVDASVPGRLKAVEDEQRRSCEELSRHMSAEDRERERQALDRVERQRQLDDTLARFDRKLDGIDVKLDVGHERMAEHDARITVVEHRLDGIDHPGGPR